MASSGVTQTIESLFGPPSEPIHVEKFIKDVTQRNLTLSISPSDFDDVKMEQECSVADLRGELERVLDDPLFSAQLVKDHESVINAFYSNFAKNKKPGRKTQFPEPEVLPPEVEALRKDMDEVKLKSWKLHPESVMFIRPPRNSDYNSLIHIKPAQSNAAAVGTDPEAIITISIYNKVPWGPSYVSRVCQQAYLACQTLQDVYEALPCIYSAASRAATSSTNPARMKPGCAICIENVLYCDSSDFSNQVSKHLATFSKGSPRPILIQRRMAETKLSSLSLRLNQPYTIFHAGSCEHFIVIEQIRLWHCSDPVSGYPQTLQVTPSLPSLCYVCHKIPAALSIVGDERLGESPSLLCEPCWSSLGRGEEAVAETVLPLSV